jgi:hypothetical protein
MILLLWYTFTHQVASGGFGTVFEGLYGMEECLPVAVKILTFNDLPSVPQQCPTSPGSSGSLAPGPTSDGGPGIQQAPGGGGGGELDPAGRSGEGVSRRRATGVWESGTQPLLGGKCDAVSMAASCGLAGTQRHSQQATHQPHQQLLPAWMGGAGGAGSLGTKAAQMAVAEVAVSGMATHPNLVPCYAMSVSYKHMQMLPAQLVCCVGLQLNTELCFTHSTLQFVHTLTQAGC